MSTTQIPRIVRSVMQKGMSAGHIPHGAAARVGGASSKGSGGGGGGGGSSGMGTSNESKNSSSAFGAAFDSEGGTYDSANATTPSGRIGPFAWGGDLTEGAKRVRQKLMDTDTAAGKALDKLASRMGQGQHLGDAIKGLMADDPTSLHTLVGAGLFKNGLEGVAKTLNAAGQEKGSNFQIVGNQVVNRATATSRTIQGENGPMEAPTSGGFSFVDDPNNPGQKIIVSTAGTAPGKAGPRPVVTQPNANTAQGGIANRDANTASKDANQDARTQGQNQKNADPMAGKPYKISKEDGDLISSTPSILGSMDILRRWAPDANGLLTGPAGDLASKLFGTNDANMVWSATKNTLAQSLMIGGVPSKYAGGMKQFLGTLPDDWKNSRFNTTELGSSAAMLRQTVNARLANVEHENGGRPYTEANQNDLREVGVIPPSAGWDNPLAMVKAGPDALKNASDEQLQFLKDHQQLLSPAERAIGKAEWLSRAGRASPQQGQDQQPQGGEQGQPAAGSPQSPAAPAQGPQQEPAPQGAPTAPSPSSASVAPPGQQSQDTTPYATDPRLAMNADQQNSQGARMAQLASQQAPV